jgi:alpha-beta hydrolase superfamily lysophospholipase
MSEHFLYLVKQWFKFVVPGERLYLKLGQSFCLLVSVNLVFIAVAAWGFSTNLAAADEDRRSSASWQDLLRQAESFYSDSNYKAALPFYVQAVAASRDASPNERIHCLRYLADCYCRTNQPDDALAQYEAIDTLIPLDDIDDRIANINDKALCFELRADWSKSHALCLSALKICPSQGKEHLWQLARTQAHLGYIEYMRSKYESAVPYFQEAEHTLDESGRTDLPAMVLRQKMAFAQAGSLYHLHRYDQAFQQFTRMYQDDVLLFGMTDLQTGWAMLALSDVLGKIHQPQQAEDWYRKAIYVFRKVNRDRLCNEFSEKSIPVAEVRQRIDNYIFGNSATPADFVDTGVPLCKDVSNLVNNHDPRTLYARPFMDAPGRVWLNPLVEKRGIVIAIHGLSLQHSSYDALARELADAWFTTVAFDVRGFGAYRQALGAEQVNFDECQRDLRLVVAAIRGDNLNTPLFILGESMGGAIALQFVAQNPQLVDGLIASVPAGKRFKQKRTAVKVAIHYLENKNRPFDIGTDVINQATRDPQLKEAWAGDPKTRSELSARELLAFQHMVNRNLAYAKEIESTPVVLFQGVRDGLVKPDATYDLFRAIASKDKSLVMVGNAEHLIFEEGCFTAPVLKGLVAWMDSHLKPANVSESAK